MTLAALRVPGSATAPRGRKLAVPETQVMEGGRAVVAGVTAHSCGPLDSGEQSDEGEDSDAHFWGFVDGAVASSLLYRNFIRDSTRQGSCTSGYLTAWWMMGGDMTTHPSRHPE